MTGNEKQTAASTGTTRSDTIRHQDRVQLLFEHLVGKSLMDQLRWHMAFGTRAGIAPATPSQPWTDKEFKESVSALLPVDNSIERNWERWKSGETKGMEESAYNAICVVLFG